MKIKGFTLIEILIVIVIIGIIAWALVPRVWHARWKANDSARKWYAYGITSAIIQYQIANKSFPNIPDDVKIWNCNCAPLTKWLWSSLRDYWYPEWLLPKDPVAWSSFYFCWAEVTWWEYIYCALNDSVLFVSKFEWEWWNAFSADFSAPDAVTSDMTLSDISDKLHDDWWDLYIFYW